MPAEARPPNRRARPPPADARREEGQGPEVPGRAGLQGLAELGARRQKRIVNREPRFFFLHQSPGIETVEFSFFSALTTF